MPKKGQKSKNFQTVTDVTINEFANSNKVINRQKKGKPIIEHNPQTETTVLNDENDDAIECNTKLKSKRKSKISNENLDPNNKYAIYPIDIWILISQHIQPEDVQRFALICRQTASICTSPSFWLNLYKKYYRDIDDLPTRLQPECMVRFCGLRACVIQTLFYTYEPFVEKLKTSLPQDFHCVVRRECIGNWTYRVKDHWIFCYKLKRKIAENSRLDRAERIRKSKKLLDIQRDIYQNSEEGCKILVIKTSSYRPLLQYYGQQAFLQLATQTLSTGFTNYKLKLTFVNLCQDPIAIVVYDPVVQIQVLDWWTPEYRKYLEQIF